MDLKGLSSFILLFQIAIFLRHSKISSSSNQIKSNQWINLVALIKQQRLHKKQNFEINFMCRTCSWKISRDFWMYITLLPLASSSWALFILAKTLQPAHFNSHMKTKKKQEPQRIPMKNLKPLAQESEQREMCEMTTERETNTTSIHSVIPIRF